MKTCSVGGCRKPHHARGMCDTHHYRWLKHGNPDVVLKRGPKPISRCDCGYAIPHNLRLCDRCRREFVQWSAETNHPLRLPLDPYLQILAVRGGPSSLSDNLRRRLYASDGYKGAVTWNVADQLACAIGLNPIAIWPEWVPDEPQLEVFEDDAA